MTDDIRVQQVVLYYRVAGTSNYTMLPTEQTFNGAYLATIPGAAVTPQGVEYYLTARDSKGTITSSGRAWRCLPALCRRGVSRPGRLAGA